jgi:hypothetical protein
MRFVVAGLLAALPVGLTGCGGGTQVVSGTVTFDNEPVKEGHIAFVPADGKGGGGGPVADGRYSVTLPRGSYRVEVNASKSMKLPAGQVGMDGAKEEVRSYIPEKYNAKTELKAEVPSPTSPLDFKLTSK